MGGVKLINTSRTHGTGRGHLSCHTEVGGTRVQGTTKIAGIVHLLTSYSSAHANVRWPKLRGALHASLPIILYDAFLAVRGKEPRGRTGLRTQRGHHRPPKAAKHPTRQSLPPRPQSRARTRPRGRRRPLLLVPLRRKSRTLRTPRTAVLSGLIRCNMHSDDALHRASLVRTICRPYRTRMQELRDGRARR